MPLNIQQRRKRGQGLKRFRSKLKRARERAAARPAPKARLMVRATVAARKLLRKKYLGRLGADYANLSYSQKEMVDILRKKPGLIFKIAKRIFPKILKKERIRFQRRKERREQK